MPNSEPRKKGRRPRGFLTRPEIQACRFFLEGMSQQDAAQKAGFSRNYAKELFAKPLLLNQINRIEKAACRAAEKKVCASRVSIAERLMYIAHLEPEDTRGNIHGQLRALRELSELLGYKAKTRVDLNLALENLSDEEIAYLRSLSHAASTGKQPPSSIPKQI